MHTQRRFWSWKIGRLRIGLRVYTHHYTNSSDRWVIQPELVYDCKERK